MPTYDYQCKKCGNIQEEFHSINDKPSILCKVCNSECEKIFSTGGTFLLQGNDWPSTNARLKQSMLAKNSRMNSKMIEKHHAGESVNSISDLKR
jgi:putative FmdB family regulatory protein